jgi:hypothetical protein
VRIVAFNDSNKTGVSFLPKIAETFDQTPLYCNDYSIFNSVVHAALAVNDTNVAEKSVTFGKMASRSYTNSRGQSIKTAWLVKFQSESDADDFKL